MSSYVERRRAEILAERREDPGVARVAKRQRVFEIASEPRRTKPAATPATLRHIAECLRRIGMPNFAFTIDQAADMMRDVQAALDDCDLRPEGSLADRVHTLTRHHREWKRLYAEQRAARPSLSALRLLPSPNPAGPLPRTEASGVEPPEASGAGGAGTQLGGET